MKVSIDKVTGRIIEMQSDAEDQTLLDNAVAQGHALDTIELREVDEEDYRTLRATQPTPPVDEMSITKRLQINYDAILDALVDNDIKALATLRAERVNLKAQT